MKDAKQEKVFSGPVYRHNEAAFFGEERPSSKGSVFQKNAAHFYGYETPKPGERPFNLPPSEQEPHTRVQRNVYLYFNK